MTTNIITTEEVTRVVVTDGTAPSNPIGGTTGSRSVANWFREAVSGDDSLDILVVGDSNSLYYSGGSGSEVSGWTDGFTAAFWKIGAPIYATPIFPLYLDGASQSQGWRVIWTAFAGGLGGNGTTGDDGITTAYIRSGNLGTRLSGGGTVAGPAFCTSAFKLSSGFGSAPNQMDSNLTSCDYAWYPSGEANRFQDYIAGMEIGATHPLGVGSEMYYRVVHAKFASSGGEFWIRCEDTAGSPLASDLQVSCAGAVDEITTTARRIGPDVTRTLGVRWRWAGAYGARSTLGVNGKFAGFLQSAIAVKKGVSVSAICWYGGATMTDISGGCVDVGDGTLATWLREARTRQIAAGGSGRVVVLLHGGANTDTGEPESWTTAATSMKTRFEAAWDSLKFPSTQLGFLMMPSHPRANPDDLTAIRSLVATTYDDSSNCLTVNLNTAASADRLVSLAYYDNGSGGGDGTPDVHLAPTGYENVSQLALMRILQHGL